MNYKMLTIVTGAVGGLLAIDGIITQGSAGMTWFALGLAVLMPVPTTTLLCRHRLRHGKRISYGTAVAGGFGVALFAYAITLVRIARLEVWTFEYCTAIFIGYGLAGLFSVLPALGVVQHYQGKEQTKG
jgi:hypothetical protein